jgi:hypothetical protein
VVTGRPPVRPRSMARTVNIISMRRKVDFLSVFIVVSILLI